MEPAKQTPAALQTVVYKFQQCSDPKQRYQLVLHYADGLSAYPDELKLPENRVLGCTSQVRQHQQQLPCAASCVLLPCSRYMGMRPLQGLLYSQITCRWCAPFGLDCRSSLLCAIRRLWSTIAACTFGCYREILID